MRVMHASGLLAAVLLAPAPLLACASSYLNVRLSGVDRDGGVLGAGDFVDWTLVLVNIGCVPNSRPEPMVRLPAEHEPEGIDQGGLFDPSLREITWSASTTPILVEVGPYGAGVPLTFSTQLLAAPPPGGTCLTASVTQGGSDRACLPATGPRLDSALTLADGSGDGIFTAAEAVELTLHLSNAGSTAIEDLHILGLLPAELADVFAVAIPPGAVNDSQLERGWVDVAGITLTPASVASLRLSARLPANIAPGTPVCPRLRLGNATLGSVTSRAPGLPVRDACLVTATLSPALTRVSPCEGSRYGGELVTLLGSGLDQAIAVQIGSEPAEILSASPVELVVQAPPGSATGAADLSVRLLRHPEIHASPNWFYTTGATRSEIRLTKKNGAVLLTFDPYFTGTVLSRSSSAQFPCDGIERWIRTSSDLSHPILGDGRSWYYRSE